ncbi:MAG: UPF0182 family protein [Ignavibacteriales bacterium]|nr:MAG: UPF0182 family protein [Ignavibacteriales bacterium]
MYNAILFILIAATVLLLYIGLRKSKKSFVTLGVFLGLFTVFFFWYMDFYGELLWFQSLGYDDRFWVSIFNQAEYAVAGAVISGLIVALLTMKITRYKKVIRNIVLIIAVFFGGSWGYSNWDVIIKFWYAVPAGVTEPIFNNDAGFYLFKLPFLQSLYSLLFNLSFISLIAIIISVFVSLSGDTPRFEYPIENVDQQFNQLYINIGILLLILTLGKYLDRYTLMYSKTGVVAGPGWTDVNILLPAYSIIIVISLIFALVFLIPVLRKAVQKRFQNIFKRFRQLRIAFILSTLAVLFLTWFIALVAIPGLFQWLRVQPNEITFEVPYISNNIHLTRYGFGLNNIEEREYPVTGDFSQTTVDSNPAIFDNIRLWDWHALQAVYKQFQEIRLYYEFTDVDVDRYSYNNKYKQVMISPRELEVNNLPQQSQTFVNRMFKYTHGFGITLASVSEFTPEGLPHLLIKNIPPVSEFPNLKVEQPRIYYGEVTNTHVVVNSKEDEFDYPSGEDNVYYKYESKSGVEISNFWRKFLFGWKFDGSSFLFSSYTSEDSRILFHRQIEERVKLLAPFLKFDEDPYIVLADGKLYWIIDAYTTSKYFPYSEPFSSDEKIELKEGETSRTLNSTIAGYLDGENYIRNSVKAVIDAYSGEVNFYIFDEKDPIIKVWNNIYPKLFKSKDKMPHSIYSHVRYPKDLLLAQGSVYSKYHMSDPRVFYNQEDLWIRATEKYYKDIKPVDPYYIMWQLPEHNKPQFTLVLPFTPKNRQVSIGWITGMCDGENYGKFLAYKFTKEKSVLGPQQVETKIDQDRFLSGQLTLWDQRGSNVIRGNTLAIPVDKTMFYVEPIYLQAETAAYPELRLVVVMHGDNLSYGETFDKALQGLFNKTEQTLPIVENKSVETKTQPTSSNNQLIKDANNAFDNYLKYLGEKKFIESSQELEKLQKYLKQLEEKSK